MNTNSRRRTRGALLALVLLLAGCATSIDTATRSPPRVDVPEPGGARTATRSPVTAPGARASAARPAGGASAYPASGATTYPATGSTPPATVASPALPSTPAGPAYPEVPSAPPGSAYPATGVPPLAPGAAPVAGDSPAASEDSFTIEMPAALPADAATGAAVPGTVTAAPPQSANRAVNILLAQADTAQREGKPDAAIAAAERALRIAPSDPAAYCQLAELRLARGERAQAEQLARKGLSHRPDPALRARLEAVLARSRP